MPLTLEVIMSSTFDRPMQYLALQIKKIIPINYQLKSKRNDPLPIIRISKGV